MSATLTYAQSKRKSIKRCGTGSLVGYSEDNQYIYIVPMRCKSWLCPRCKWPKAFREIDKIKSGLPTRFITLTADPQSYSSKKSCLLHMKEAWKDLIREIRRVFGPTEYVLVWELTKRGWPHAHILTRGTYIPQAWLSTAWSHFNFSSIVHINKVNNPEKAAEYIGKYLFKDLARTIELLGHAHLLQYSKHYVQEDLIEGKRNPQGNIVWCWRPEDPDEVCRLMRERGHYELPLDPESTCITFLQTFEDEPVGSPNPRWIQPDLNYCPRQEEVDRMKIILGGQAS